MSNKIKFTIEPEKTGTGVIKVGTLEPTDFAQNQELLSKADRFDGTNVRGRLRLNDTNFYNYQKYYKTKKREQEEQKDKEQEIKSFAYAHQIQTVETILKLPSGGLLADQVGMGKTIEAGMLIAELAYRDEWRTLIITLSNDELIRNWHDEMFDKFGLNLALVKGETQDDIKKVFDILCEYQKTGIIKDFKGNTTETISKVEYKYGGALVPFSYLVDQRFIDMVEDYNKNNPKDPFHIDLIVVDESHRYTSSDSSSSDNKISALHHLQMSQIVKFNGNDRIEKKGRILLLTATPIKNDLNELVELMQIINPKYTVDDFRKDLGLLPTDPFDLTTVLEKPRGVNRWWEWFSRFGERHTRNTTIYDKDKRRYGVHWKPKNSHSYYFNDNNKYPTRPYFVESESNTKIKRVFGDSIDKERLQTPIKGKRESNVCEYESVIPNMDMKKFNRLMSFIAYIKHEISDEELKEVPFNFEEDGIKLETIYEILSKPMFEDWRHSIDKYSSLGNEKKEIEKKKIIENAVARFLEQFQNKGKTNGLFLYEIIKFLLSKIKNQQKDKNGIEKSKRFESLALILCSDNFFLQVEKMLTLGNIINSEKHANEKIIIFCKDDAERRMLVENSHFWDYSGRYMEIDSVAKISSMSAYDINYARYSNVVSIAYTTDAEGLNLQSYHTMINYSIVLSPLHMEQRIGRIDRIGQKNEMDVYFLANAQDVEGYVLRFFEYELELFSNWSGDTTASTYFDAKDNGEDVKLEFDNVSIIRWNQTQELPGMNDLQKVEKFEESISKVFDNVRERVIKISSFTKEIDDMKKEVEETKQDDLEMYFDPSYFL